jgi:TonB family protein
MRWLAMIFALVLATPAFGQMPASPAGHVINCNAFNPGTHDRAATVLAVNISSTGDVTAASVKTSSGNKDLDAAAIACASHMYFSELTADGRPVDLTWIVAIAWATDGTASYFVPKVVGNENACAYPQVAQEENISGSVTLVLRIGADGKVQSTAIVKSSGEQILDTASRRCAASWTFPPALIAGQPAAIEWSQELNWGLY